MPDRETVRPGFILPRPPAPSGTEDRSPKQEFRSTAGCFGAAGIFFLFVSLLLGPAISAAAVPVAVVVFVALFSYYLFLDSKEQKFRRHLEILEEACGRDYITVNMVAPQDRPTLRRAQQAVDTILGTPLHRSGQLSDAPRNTFLLCVLEWRIACDLYRAAQVERDLAEAGFPRGGEDRVAAYAKAVTAIRALRGEAKERAEAIHGYAVRVRRAQDQLDQARCGGEHDPIAINLPVEGGHLPREAAESLAAAREDARRVSRIHQELGP